MWCSPSRVERDARRPRCRESARHPPERRRRIGRNPRAGRRFVGDRVASEGVRADRGTPARRARFRASRVGLARPRLGCTKGEHGPPTRPRSRRPDRDPQGRPGRAGAPRSRSQALGHQALQPGPSLDTCVYRPLFSLRHVSAATASSPSLDELHASTRPELFVLYGRRRVGKTELLQQFCASVARCTSSRRRCARRTTCARSATRSPRPSTSRSRRRSSSRTGPRRSTSARSSASPARRRPRARKRDADASSWSTSSPTSASRRAD